MRHCIIFWSKKNKKMMNVSEKRTCLFCYNSNLSLVLSDHGSNTLSAHYSFFFSFLFSWWIKIFIQISLNFLTLPSKGLIFLRSFTPRWFITCLYAVFYIFLRMDVHLYDMIWPRFSFNKIRQIHQIIDKLITY
jgi:hypothetical protein